MKKSSFVSFAGILSAASLAAPSPSASAADAFWLPEGTGSFIDGANWDPAGVPTIIDDAYIFNGGTAEIGPDDIVEVSRLLIDNGSVVQTGGSVSTVPFGNFESPGAYAIGSAVGMTGSYTVSGASNLSGGRVRIGYAGGTGSMSLGGTSIYAGGDNQDTWVGNGAGSVGSLTISDSAQWNILNDWFVVGRSGGEGTVNISGNDSEAPTQVSITGGGNVVFGDGAGSTATAHVSGSANVFTTGGEIWVGNAGATGTLNLSGNATMVAQDHWIAIGRRGDTSGSIGTATISGNAQLRKEGASGDRHIVIADGEGAQGTLTVKDSALVSSNQGFRVAQGGSATGTLIVQDNATVNVGGELWIGQNAHGTVNLEGGTITVNDWVAVGREGAVDASSGALNISGGTFNKTGKGNFIVNGATGTVTHTGGTLNVIPHVDFANDGNTWLSEQGGKNSTWTATGGTANLGRETQIGRDSVATMTIGGTANYTNQNVILGTFAAGVGTLNLNGGTFTANSITKGEGTGTVNFNGGIVRAGAASADYFAGFADGDLNVQAGGLKIDTDVHAVGITQALSGAGGLTKMGTGALTLSGMTTFTGLVSVEAGALLLDATGGLGGAPALSVAADADLVVQSAVSLNEDIVLFLAPTSTLALEFDGTSTIAALWIDGTPIDPDTYTVAELQALGGGVTFTGNDDMFLTVTSTVPEPGTVALIGCGLLAAVWRLRRRS